MDIFDGYRDQRRVGLHMLVGRSVCGKRVERILDTGFGASWDLHLRLGSNKSLVGVGDDGKRNQAKAQRNVDRAFHFGMSVLHFRVSVQCTVYGKCREREKEGRVWGEAVCVDSIG
jgi:hypothetical protein